MRTCLLAALLALQLLAAPACPAQQETPKSPVEIKSAAYLNEQQRQLGQGISPDPADYYYFADSPDSLKNELSGFKVKPWTESEKQQISAIMAFVLHRAPGLLLRGSCGNRIGLFRVSTFPKGMVDVSALAGTTTRAITMADSFFLHDRMTHNLLHELVHAADCGDRTGYSKDWVLFAGPIISELTKKIKLQPASETRDFEKTMRQNGVWPTRYACSNLGEAFAEYFAEYIEGSDFPISQNFVDKIGAPFLLPNTEDLQWIEQYKRTLVQEQDKNYKLAISEYEAIIKADPLTPMPYVRLSACLIENQDYKRALIVAEQGMVCFDVSKVPAADDARLRLLQTRAWLLGRQGLYLQASNALDQVLQQDGSNVRALTDRAWYAERRCFVSVRFSTW